jgi:hypothetical protein
MGAAWQALSLGGQGRAKKLTRSIDPMQTTQLPVPLGVAEDIRKAHTGLQLASPEGRRSESPLRWLTQTSRADSALG